MYQSIVSARRQRAPYYGAVSPAIVERPRPACAGEDPELFFAHGASSPRIARAQAICRRCPLLVSCHQGALERDEEYGVWGGLTEDERRSLKRGARRSARAA
ncbi:WhiB family transcriptional regulator [Streptomyces mauvecolor]|uniref:Transcriptional regulator WhiB n=1 Tax=Streptomyces mauvecolor TaxID=58345 RepID=A0ABV9UEY2_9ACTN